MKKINKKIGTLVLGGLLSLTAIVPASADTTQTLDLNNYVNKSYNLTTSLSSGDAYYNFTAPVSGTYTFQTQNAAFDTYGILRDLTTNKMYKDNSSGEGKNFLIKEHLSKGDSCKLTIQSFAFDIHSRKYGKYTLKIDVAKDQ